MNKKTLLATILFALPILGVGAQGVIPRSLLSNSHDVESLHNWGPYSKRYAGISHIADLGSGVMVDFSVMPGYYRRSYMVPNVLYESGYHPWRCTPEMTQITYRYELEWKDRVYVDVTYHLLDSQRVLVEMECVNNTSANQNLLLQNVASLACAEEYPIVALRGAEQAVVLYGCDYSLFEPAVRRHDYALVYDGWRRGEKRDANALSGSVLSAFGENKGDKVAYHFGEVGSGSSEPRMVALRCKVPKGAECSLEVAGQQVSLLGSGRFELVQLGVELPKSGQLLIESLGGGCPVVIDAVVVGTADALAKVEVEGAPIHHRPTLHKSEGYFIAKYEGTDNHYGVAWNYKDSEVREFANGELDVFMRRGVHRHPPKYFNGDNKGHFVSAFQRPIVLSPHSTKTIYNLLATGERGEVEAALKHFNLNEAAVVAEAHSSKSAAPQRKFLPQAAEYALGEQLLEATLLTNVVYPVYTQGNYIRHFTPGKNWNSLYTWDLGCISWALAHISPTKAFETIRAYTTEQGAQSAFIHHGTPLPMQFFAWAELNNSSAYDKESAEFLYERLKRYYDFMVGNHPHSTTRMPSGLIRTWDYFYSSGGWDDYPPQHELRSNTHLYPSVAPMVSSAYYLRAAKILRMQAERLGKKSDVVHYTREINALKAAILTHAWDEESGYFSYVMHNEEGTPTGLYRAADGSNFNQGLDGVSPLVAGICTPEQTTRLVDNIFSPKHLWTSVGISTVDQSASYYDHAGYWNGSVWIPHQMMLWKAMLDNNLTDKAHQIAFTALKAWNVECSESYNSPEHFIISSGRGAGWHNFSGLSSPMACWYHSYFCKGTLTTGFDVGVENGVFSAEESHYTATVRFDKDAVGKKVAIVACLNPDHTYQATLNGKPLHTESPYPGLLYVSLEASRKPATLVIEAK
ncbi:MAG: glycoside hydrolase [Tidjanibacter sp.]|nr:glycoside hydrolase [Tidjanibacter sp.]